MRKVGTIDFEFVGDPVILEVHVFLTEKFKGVYSKWRGAYSTTLDIYGGYGSPNFGATKFDRFIHYEGAGRCDEALR